MPTSKPPNDLEALPLPSDIIFLILTHFADDRASLRQLSLVSKSWLYPSQYYLFSTLFINLPRSQTTGDDEKNSLESYLDILAHRLNHYTKNFPPTLSTLVHKLVIARVRLHNPIMELDDRIPHAHVELGILKAVLRRLPSLRSLTLHLCAIGLASQPQASLGSENKIATTATSSRFHDFLITSHPLQELVLSRVKGSVEGFRALFSQVEVEGAVSMLDCRVANHPPSETLTAGVRYGGLGDGPVGEHSGGDSDGNDARSLSNFTVHPSFSGLRSFTILPDWRTNSTPETSTVVTALFSSFTSLTHLDIGHSAPTDDSFYYNVQNLIRERGNRLLHLRLDLSHRLGHSDYTREQLHALDLGKYCPSLKTLHVFTFMSTSQLSTTNPLPLNDVTSLRSIKLLISSANPAALRKVIIGFELWLPLMDRGVEMMLRNSEAIERGVKELDEILSKMGGLDAVEVGDEWNTTDLKAWVWRDSEVPNFFMDYMEEKLTRTRERGILRVFR